MTSRYPGRPSQPAGDYQAWAAWARQLLAEKRAGMIPGEPVQPEGADRLRILAAEQAAESRTARGLLGTLATTPEPPGGEQPAAGGEVQREHQQPGHVHPQPPGHAN